MVKVAPTAILKGTSGSCEKRTEIAAAKTQMVFEEIQDIFIRQKAPVTRETLHEIIKKHAPNVKFNLMHYKDSPNAGEVETVYKNNIVKSFDIKVPMLEHKGRMVIGADKTEVLMHEIRHFFDYITQPKLSAKSNHQALFDLDAGYAIRNSIYDDFYEQKLYIKEKASEKGFLGLFKGKEDKQAKLEKEFKKLFENTPKSEQILLLQEFRNGLMTEKNAYRQGIELEGLLHINLESQHAKPSEGLEIFKKIEMKNYEKEADKVLEQYDFDSKISVIEKLLGEKILQVRSAHKLSLEA